jgi:predicted transcriptional regulator
MAKTKTGLAALISIKPEYADQLMSGSKRVEFRRMGPKGPVEKLLVYATLPVGALVGVLEVLSKERATPSSLWKEYGEVGGIKRNAFFSYFDGVTYGDAFVVGKVWRFSCPLPLQESGVATRAPQSFQYIDSKRVERLIATSEVLAREQATISAA